MLPATGGHEFPEGASEWPPGLDRREFVKLLGASLALGGVAGCMRRTEGTIVPYVVPPENALPGIAEFYATAIPVEGFARGILVESNLGRPTKIEGNPDHPESLGATDAITQASILSLYDPERSRSPLHRGAPATWDAFEADWAPRRADLLASQGSGMAILTEPTTSPTLLREVGLFLGAFPKAKWYQHTPLAGYAVDGLQPDFDLGDATVLLSIGSDCLFRHPACIRYARAFAKARRIEGGRCDPSRFYAIESTPSVTGVLADHRLPASPARMRLILDAVAGAIAGSFSPLPALTADEAAFVSSLVRDLRANAPHVACIAGPEQGAEVQRWALGLNARLGAGGGSRLIPSVRSDSDPRSAGDIQRLSDSVAAGEVAALIFLGSNPAYTSAAFRRVEDQVAKLAFSLHLGEHADETAALCSWHLPEAHFLETWGDLRAYDGTATVLQPLIEPLFGGRSAAEILRMLARGRLSGGYEIVRETWRGEGSGPEFESRWAEWLRRGTIDEAAKEPRPRGRGNEPTFPRLAKDEAARGLSLVLAPDASVLDGRWSNNAWLQELPRPLTHLVWDNAALISPALAEATHVGNGDLLLLECGGSSVEAAALVLPGHADDCVTLTLGYGRTRAGSIGNGRGFDAYGVRAANLAWVIPGLQLKATGRSYPLVTTQHHFAMEGRDLVRVVEPGSLHVQPNGEHPSMYKEWKKGENAWGMSIDLSTCLGCNACVAACQAENNIPTVGKDQVSRGREMHWIRIDQYFDGDPANPRVLSQPVPCMHCENAPCELVCPVGATVHSSEGLNEMVYNRCVGTRYCSNNCPYKVRRFNFLDYRANKDSTVNLQKNPDVTVRERGVMEKCTYCVQRINSARISAAKENRPIRDGEIRTACQQACPVEAIVFGNLADPESLVSRRKMEPTNYSLLGELNTRPRTTYLAKLRNPGPAPTA
jgi:molybdopterin-containing oxidoreductase family iron-sulfur binding subunit